MSGNYTCINCGHIGYTYGSPIWAQSCESCNAPVGKKIGKGSTIRTISGNMFRRYFDRFDADRTIFTREKAVKIAKKIRSNGYNVRLRKEGHEVSITGAEYNNAYLYSIWIEVAPTKWRYQ